MWIPLLVVVVTCSISYRLGGWKHGPGSWIRDWIIPPVVITAMVFVFKIQAPWWAYLLSWGLMGGMLTTYWDKSKNAFKDAISRIINCRYPEDNFYLHGFMIGLGLLPLVLTGSIGWFPFLGRTVALGCLMGLLCDNTDNVWVEELGRGAFIVLTLPILIWL